MTNHVNISITFTIENGKQNKLHFKLSAETLGKDLKRIEESLKVRLNTSATTIGRDDRRLGNEIAAQDQNYFPKQKGKIQSEVLYGESDGILVRLQKDR